MQTKVSDLVKTHWQSPLGRLDLASSPQGLVGVWFEGAAHRPNMTDWPVAKSPWFDQATEGLAAYFSGQAVQFKLPLDMSFGTPFQLTVWRALLGLQYGQTLSYGVLSQHIGQPRAVRAVAAAIGRNPLSIIVPCHRVVGADGSLTGYAGGLARKASLLRLEGAIPPVA